MVHCCYCVTVYACGGTDLDSNPWLDGEVLAKLIVILLPIHLVPQYKPSDIVGLEAFVHVEEVWA